MTGPACPRCSVRLTPRPKTGVGQYYCSNCLGFVAPVNSLRRFLAPLEVKKFMHSSVQSPTGQNPCTHCRKKMHVVWHLMGEHEVELDFCEFCLLVWFDTGEWNDMRSANGEKPLLESKAESLARARAIIEAENQMQRERRTTSFERIEDASTLKTVLSFAGLPVEEEDDHFSVHPWVTWLLIATCFVVAFFTFRDLELAVLRFAYFDHVSVFDRVWTSISSFFLHGGYAHLLGNMYFLWIFGDNVEDELGKRRYIALLALATLGGNLCFGMFDPRSETMPAIGASGGIAGLVAFYLIRFPHRRFLMRFLFFFLIAIPAYLFAVIFFFKDAIGAVSQMSGLTEVSHLSHVGGALVGAAGAILMRRKVKNVERWA